MLKKGTASEILFHNDKNKVVLMVHCFRGSPRTLQELALQLYNQGYSIYNLRLPGHCHLDEEEIFSVKKGDWENQIKNIFFDLANIFDKVYFCGLSIGATLLFNLACKYPDHIEKFAMLSPYLKPRLKHRILSPIMAPFNKKLTPREMDCSIKSEIFDDFISFFPVAQGLFCLQIASKARHNIKKRPAPALVVFARNDGDMIFDLQYNLLKDNPLFTIHTLEKSLHQITLDTEKDRVHQLVTDYFNDKEGNRL